MHNRIKFVKLFQLLTTHDRKLFKNLGLDNKLDS